MLHAFVNVVILPKRPFIYWLLILILAVDSYVKHKDNVAQQHESNSNNEFVPEMPEKYRVSLSLEGLYRIGIK